MAEANDALVTLSIPRPMLEIASGDALVLAQTLQVNSQVTLDMASAEYSLARERLDTLDAMRMKLKRPILEAGRQIDDFFRDALESQRRIADIYNAKMARYLNERERARQQEEARARELERAERERIAREAQERERKGREEAERLRAAAAQAQQAGDRSAAGQLDAEALRAEMAGVQDAQQQLALIDMVSIEPAVEEPELRGVTKPRARYSAEVVDLDALIKAVYEERAPKAYVMANQETLDRTATALREEFKVDGCKLLVDYSVQRSRKKPKE